MIFLAENVANLQYTQKVASSTPPGWPEAETSNPRRNSRLFSFDTNTSNDGTGEQQISSIFSDNTAHSDDFIASLDYIYHQH